MGERRPRVGFLCYGLDRPFSGTTRVAHQLGTALRETGECDVVYLTPYRHGPFRGGTDTAWYLPGCRLLPGLMALGGPLTAWAARRLDLDVVHDPVGVSPFTVGRRFGRFARVLAIHDTIALVYPQGYPWLNNVLHRHFVPATLPNVDAAIADSEHGRDEVIRLIGFPSTRTHAIPLGVDPRFSPVPVERARAVAARYGLAGPYVLSVGAQQARKNVSRAVEAMDYVRRDFPTHTLAIAGPAQWTFRGVDRAIGRSHGQDTIVRLGYVPDEDLAALYSGADLFVFPSLYEGFGLPVLEAMACGTPVVCADATSLPEVAGDAALLVDPHDSAAIAEGITRILRDTALAAELRARGRERARHFTWDRTARRTLDVYRQAIGA